jgi:hypothetical protein
MTHTQTQTQKKAQAQSELKLYSREDFPHGTLAQAKSLIQRRGDPALIIWRTDAGDHTLAGVNWTQGCNYMKELKHIMDLLLPHNLEKNQ